TMQILLRNIKGLSSKLKKSYLKIVVSKTRAEIYFIQEAMLETDDNFEYRYSAAKGSSGGIITIWDKSKFVFERHGINEHVVVIEGKWVEEGGSFILINVYAPNGCSDQKLVWEEIGA
ncbi:hypothetical protein ES319_D08G048000v1, partial [Gossypium barbadense]